MMGRFSMKTVYVGEQHVMDSRVSCCVVHEPTGRGSVVVSTPASGTPPVGVRSPLAPGMLYLV